VISPEIMLAALVAESLERLRSGTASDDDREPGMAVQLDQHAASDTRRRRPSVSIGEDVFPGAEDSRSTGPTAPSMLPRDDDA
jgi:hypothetical protein